MHVRAIKLFGLGAALGLLLAVALIVALPMAHQSPDCSVTVQPGQAIQPEIDRAPEGAVICLGVGTWEEALFIKKGLILRGAGPEQTLIKNVDVARPVIAVRSSSKAMVTIEGLKVTQSDSIQGVGIYIFTNGPVVIRNVHIVKTGLDGLQVRGIWTSVDLLDSKVSGSGEGDLLNREGGISVGGFARLTIANSQLLENVNYGLIAFDSASVQLIGSQVSGNGGGGLLAAGQAVVALNNSLVSANEFFGVFAMNLAVVKVSESTIEGNGLGFGCDRVEKICNGILLQDQAVLALLDSKIINNMDWGLAVVRRVCGYTEDKFTGQPFFDGDNTITGNNRSGNHTAQGNPGKWNPFENLPPGNVCLQETG